MYDGWDDPDLWDDGTWGGFGRPTHVDEDEDLTPRDLLLLNVELAWAWQERAVTSDQRAAAGREIDRASRSLETYDASIAYLAPITARGADADRLARAGGRDFSGWRPDRPNLREVAEGRRRIREFWTSWARGERTEFDASADIRDCRCAQPELGRYAQDKRRWCHRCGGYGVRP